MVVVVRWGGLALSLVSNLNPSCIELELGLSFDKNILKDKSYSLQQIVFVFSQKPTPCRLPLNGHKHLLPKKVAQN